MKIKQSHSQYPVVVKTGFWLWDKDHLLCCSKLKKQHLCFSSSVPYDCRQTAGYFYKNGC